MVDMAFCQFIAVSTTSKLMRREIMNHVPSILTGLFIAFFFTGCATPSSGEYTDQWSQDKPKIIKLNNGFILRYLRTGNGPPLVLMHTIRTQLDYFERLVPALKKHYEVYVLDLPGHGQSSILPVEYTEELFRKSVSEFITKLDLQEVTLVGESIGGVLALTVATELPGKVTQVVSLNPYDYGGNFGGGIRRSSNGWIISLFNVFGAYTIEPRFVLAAILKGGFYDPSRLPEDLLTEFYRTGKRDGYRAVEYSVFKNWRSWIGARKLYSDVTVPVTLVYSRDDWSNSRERERNRLAIPDAEFIIVDKAGHFASVEKPGEVANIVLSTGGQKDRPHELRRGETPVADTDRGLSTSRVTFRTPALRAVSESW
jgi:pimeloyl-ACP methyl ester carboxylesterase